MSSSDAMVRFADVQNSYDGETLVVKNLDLDIAKGEFLAMLGLSGSGKTTTLMMLAGFEPTTHGEIYVKGQPIVYVTHDQSEAPAMSNRIALFNDCVVQQLSTPDELYERPVNSFVAQFIGENNKLKGTVAEVGKDKLATVKLESGDIVKALAVNVGKLGERTLLSGRPERAEINPTAKSADVIPKGRIAELIYLGDHIRARLEVAGHKDFIVKVPNKGGADGVEEDKDVKVGWRSEDCRALDYLEFQH